MRRLAAALLDEHLGPLSPPPPAAGAGGERRILDAGCGTGGTTAWLRRYGAVVGVELAGEAAPYWGQQGLHAMARGSVAALPLLDASFDLVTCFDVLYHRQVADEAAVLAEFWRVLQPGGLLLLRVPAYDWLQAGHDAAVHTRRRYTRGEVVQGVRAAGFEVLTATYGNGLLLPLAVAKRVGERWRGASQEEMAVPPAPVNTLFAAALGLEARVLPRWPLPAGLSVLVVGRKPAGAPLAPQEHAAPWGAEPPLLNHREGGGAAARAVAPARAGASGAAAAARPARPLSARPPR
jgi:SAM-dependent methyltransferase